ncbi:MAG: DUF1028 domain-containing protein [Cyanobacteria bacterium J06642_2]
MTFSIVAFDAKTGMMGIAVATKHLAVGALVPHAKARVGAIATQAETNPLLGIRGIERLEQACHMPTHQNKNASAERVLQTLINEDIAREQRQLHLVNHYGDTAAWTGRDCIEWAGHFTFPGFSVAGNMLTGEPTLTAMADEYHRAEREPFCHRLLLALAAGDAAGGDKRGRQSAALYVVDVDVYPYLDLRVDHHEQPIESLRILFEESCKDYYRSFRQSMPSE